MKKAIILSALFCTVFSSSFSTFGQTNRDSLWGVWINEQNDARTRVLAIEEFELFNSDFSIDTIYQIIKELDTLVTQNPTQELIGMRHLMYGSYYIHSGEQSKSLNEIDKALVIFEAQGDIKHLADLFNFKGICFRRMGLSNRALHFFKRSLKKNEEIKNLNAQGDLLLNIGVLYADMGRVTESVEYTNEALVLFKKVDDQVGVLYAYANAGEDYLVLEDYDKAYKAYKAALDLNRILDFDYLYPDIYTGMSKCYFKTNEVAKGMEYGRLSVESAEQTANPFVVSFVLNQWGNSLIEIKEYKKAIEACKKSLTIADKDELDLNAKDACYCLYSANKAANASDKALFYLDRYLVLLQKLDMEEVNKNFEMFEMEKDLLQDSLNYEGKVLNIKLDHAQETAQKDKQRSWLIFSALAILILAGGLFGRLRHIKKSKAIIEHEKERSESLLLNILPYEIAEELKEKGHTDAQLIDHVTVLFTDFKGFTAMSEQLSPKELVNDLNVCFSEFDRIIGEHNIEKIKTIGDAYMAAGGLPTPNQTHALDVVQAAFKMRDFVEAGKAKKIEAGLPYFEIRIGVHTGPVVAGIVGVKKFQYDIWGDTVNTASRMESSGEVGKVNISQATYELLMKDTDASAPLSVHNTFTFESRGKIEAKGKGEMEMYFVSKA
jgi:adenylate cyclase